MDRRMGAHFAHAPMPVSDLTIGRKGTPAWPRGVAAALVVGLALAACSSSAAISTAAPATAMPAGVTPAGVTPAGVTPPPATSSVLANTPTPIMSVEPSLATGAPTSIDPCQLVTTQEASQMAGVTYPAGKESTTSGGGKMCTYGYQTADVFEVIVGQAPDKATAQAGLAQAKADIEKQANNIAKFTELPSFADGAAYYTGSFSISGVRINAGAFYALKGLVFFGFSDLSNLHPAPSVSALEAQATTILGRLP